MGIGFASGPGEEPIMLDIHGFQTAGDRTKAIQKWKDESAKKETPLQKGK